MKPLGGHQPLWPRYRPAPRDKSPAILSKAGLYGLDGKRLARVCDHRELVAEGIRLKLDVFTEGPLADSELGYAWLHQAVQDEKTEVCCVQDGTLVGVRGRGAGNSVCWVCPVRVGKGQGPTDCLRSLVELGDFTVTGFPRSGASCGFALMQVAHFDAKHPRQSAPTAPLRAALRAGGIGGRVDTPALGETLEAAWEEDMRSAYPTAAAGPLPVGTACRVLVEEDHWATWYCQCEVTIPWRLMWSPILVRTDLGNRQLTEPGTYTVWLWKEEANAARELGCSVVPTDGWAWRQTSPLLAEWAGRMADLRATAPSAELSNLVKLAAVGAIGRHGMPAITYQLIPTAEAPPTARPYLKAHGSNPFTDWSIQETGDPKANALSYWHSYIQMSVRLRLYQRILVHVAQGNRVLATDYDCIRLERPPALNLSDPAWRVSALTNVTFRHPRWVESDQKTRTPGVTFSRGDAESAETDPYARLTAGEYAQLRTASKKELAKRDWLAGMRRAQSGTFIPDDEFWKRPHNSFRSA